MASVALTASVSSCSSDTEEVQNPETSALAAGRNAYKSKTYALTVVASKGSDMSTRALSIDGDGSLTATWESGDEVRVYDDSDNLIGTLTAAGDGASTTLSGSITAVGIAVDDELKLEFCSADYTTQDGTLTGSATSIDKVCDYATATVKVTAVDDENIATEAADFANRQAVCKFTLTQSVGKLYVRGGKYDITVTPAVATSEFYVALPQTGGSVKTTYRFTGVSDAAVYVGTKKANVVDGNYYTANVTMTVESRAVDLGLPSGRIWATRNVGADSPEETGLYFAWGETTGYDKGTDHNFMWGYYAYGSAWNSLTKYNTSASQGSVDNKTMLELEDDAAYVNWGDNWRMPTAADMQELLSETNSEWTTEGGVNGYRFSSKADATKYIFLPAAGYRRIAALNDEGNYGYYWSSTLPENYPDYAYSLRFYDGGASVEPFFNRCNGCPVRAVIR